MHSVFPCGETGEQNRGVRWCLHWLTHMLPECVDMIRISPQRKEESLPAAGSLFWRRWRDLNPRVGFLRRPPGFQDRTLQPLGYISVLFNCLRFPLRYGGKPEPPRSKKCRVSATLQNRTFRFNPRFSRPPRYDHFGNPSNIKFSLLYHIVFLVSRSEPARMQK